MSNRHYWVHLSSWWREGGSGFLESEVCPLWPQSYAKGYLSIHEKSYRGSYGFCTDLFTVTSVSHEIWDTCITGLKLLKALPPNVLCEQVQGSHLHSLLATFSDLLAVTLFMPSYSSFTVKLSIFHQKWAIICFSARTTRAKGIPDIWHFIPVTNLLGQIPILHCLKLVFTMLKSKDLHQALPTKGPTQDDIQ